MEKLSIFISSPGDVVAERVIALNVVRRLADEFARHFAIQPIDWEHEPIQATASFQAQIPRTKDADICIFILWARLGTAVRGHDGKQYASGTEYEFVDALSGHRESGSPDLLVYRKVCDPVISGKWSEETLLGYLRQREAIEAFIERWFRGADGSFTAGFHDFATAIEFEDRLDAHLRKLIVGRLRLAGSDEPITSGLWKRGSPFRGLDTFDVEHALIYCGRTAAVHEIINALRRQAIEGRPFVLVLGPSGAGKSSLARAGVVPVLTRPGVIEGVRLWCRTVVRPAEVAGDLMMGLAVALTGPAAFPGLATRGSTIADLAQAFRDSPQTASLLIRREVASISAGLSRGGDPPNDPDVRLVLVLDQLEEIFTERHTSAEREGFVDAISALVHDGLVWVVATLRSDFYPRCSELSKLIALKEGAGQYDLLPPTLSELQRMIRQPARMAGLRFETRPDADERLDDTLVTAAAREPAALPLLEFVLQELYARSSDGLLTYASFEAMGGLEGALASHAEATFNELEPAVQACLPALFAATVTTEPGDNARVVQRRPTLDDLRDPDLRKLADAFVSTRLFATGRTDDGVPTVGVAHEALLHCWPRAQAWITENKSFLRTRAHLGSAATLWLAEAQAETFLLHDGPMLEEAKKLVRENRSTLSADEIIYIDKSIRFAYKLQLRRRLLVLTAVFIPFFLFAFAGLHFLFYERESVEFYRLFAKRWGMPVGIGRLTQQDAQRRQYSLKFFRDGWFGSVRRFEIVDGFGGCAPAHPMTEYFVDTSIFNFTSRRECWQYFSEEGDKSTSEMSYDRAFRAVYRFQYFKNSNLAEYTRENGFALSQTPSGATHVKFKYMENGPLAGFETGFRIFGPNGKLAAGAKGEYGKDFVLDHNGMPTRLTNIGADDKPAADADGIVETRTLFDPSYNIMETSYFDKEGRPANASNGISIVKYHYDNVGNYTGHEYLDAGGQPAVLNGCYIDAISYDSDGRVTSFACLGRNGEKVRYDGCIAENKFSYDQKQQVVLISSFDEKGSPCANPGESYRIRIAYDAAGDKKEEDFLDNDDRPMPVKKGSCSVRFEYDKNGNLTRSTSFDKRGQILLSN